MLFSFERYTPQSWPGEFLFESSVLQRCCRIIYPHLYQCFQPHIFWPKKQIKTSNYWIFLTVRKLFTDVH